MGTCYHNIWYLTFHRNETAVTLTSKFWLFRYATWQSSWLFILFFLTRVCLWRNFLKFISFFFFEYFLKFISTSCLLIAISPTHSTQSYNLFSLPNLFFGVSLPNVLQWLIIFSTLNKLNNLLNQNTFYLLLDY